jgi:hypothetical protein
MRNDPLPWEDRQPIDDEYENTAFLEELWQRRLVKEDVIINILQSILDPSEMNKQSAKTAAQIIMLFLEATSDA